MDFQTRNKKQILVFKYGGNAMTNLSLKKEVLKNIGLLKKKGFHVIISHGGGPAIQQMLTKADIKSEFVYGHRKTTPEAYELIEMALVGKVNGDLVRHMNQMGYHAVGLSGKDGKTVMASKRTHYNQSGEAVDLGRVGNISSVNPKLIWTLLQNEFIPVIACVADNESGEGFNINGDLFAGHIAGTLQADQYIVLTDVNGLQMDKNNPDSLIKTLKLSDTHELIEKNIIQGGMIPKIESCVTALNLGARQAKIINGTQPDQIIQAVNNENIGTTITKS